MCPSKKVTASTVTSPKYDFIYFHHTCIFEQFSNKGRKFIRAAGMEIWKECRTHLGPGQLKPNSDPSGFAPSSIATQQMQSDSLPGSTANSRDSLELKIGRCWQQLMLLLTVPNWVGYLQKADGQGGTPAICYKAAQSPLSLLLQELRISWHLVGKPGTVIRAESNPLEYTK